MSRDYLLFEADWPVEPFGSTVEKCPCGSDKGASAEYDARGLFLCYACMNGCFNGHR